MYNDDSFPAAYNSQGDNMKYIMLILMLSLTGCAKQYSTERCLHMRTMIKDAPDVVYFNYHCEAQKLTGKRNVNTSLLRKLVERQKGTESPTRNIGNID